MLKIAEHDAHVAALLEDGLKLPPIVARILAARGIGTCEDGTRFLHPKIEHLSDPFLLPDMAQAADMVAAAVGSGRRIGLFGDYDADGITATALVLNFLTEAGAQPQVYLPAREEGYGLNAQAVRDLRARGVDLLICLDCGSSNVSEIDLANSLGMEVVVIDHHETADPLPAAAALVNPKRKDSVFPTRELAACGVAFFFLIALRRVMDAGNLLAAPVNLKRQLDLAALGTVADMVPLTGDNRVLVKFGMEMMQKQPRAWLKSFFRQNMIYRQRLDNYALSFIIIPRINAAGRVSDPKAALEFLIASGEEACDRLLSGLNTANRTRQDMEEAVIGEAMAMMEADGTADRQSLVLFKEDWPVGVIGIAAQKLAEGCGKPCIIFTRVDGAWKGSARGAAGLDLYGAVSTLSEMLLKFGGHRYACGLSVRDEEMHRFPGAFEEAVAGALAGREKVVAVDAVLEFEDLTAGLVESIELLAPFGFGNPRPAFLLTPSAVSGAGNRSLRLTDRNARVWHGNTQRRMEVPGGPGVQVVASPEFREEMGERFIHLHIREFVTAPQG